MNGARFFIGFAFPILLMSSWRVIGEEVANTPIYIPVTDMLLTEDTSVAPKISQNTGPIAPGEIPVNEMLLDEEQAIEDEIAEESSNKDDEDLVPPPFFSFIDEHQQLVSDRLKQYTQGIDNYFTGDTSVDEGTGSYLRITLESLWQEGQSAEFDGSVSLKLRLPKTQKQLRLVISNDFEEQKSALDKETNSQATPTEGENNSFFAGIEKTQTRGEWKLRPSIGLKIRSPLVLYFRLRASRDIKFENWNANLYQSFYWFDDATGFGSDTTMRWDRPVNDTLLFRSNSFIRYTDEVDYYEMSQTFSLIHSLSHKRSITYKIGAFGQSEPTTHATTYLLNALYRSNIHKDYLFLDVQPQLLFEEENNFEGRTEILIRLQLFYRG